MPVRVAFLILAICGCASGCASSPRDMRTSTEPEGPREKSRAHPAAYGIVDTFTFGTPQHVRPPNDFKFYYKNCELTDPQSDRAFFSKTAYSCSDPW